MFEVSARATSACRGRLDGPRPDLGPKKGHQKNQSKQAMHSCTWSTDTGGDSSVVQDQLKDVQSIHVLRLDKFL